MDIRLQKVLEQICHVCHEILKENLVGIYIHGSAVFDCFSWEKSDVDFLTVVRKEPGLQEKMEFIRKLLEMDAPLKGLEMSMVLEKDCRRFTYPTPFVLHFSEMHRKRCMEDLEGCCRSMKGADKDLAAHFTVIRAAGIALRGREIPEVFAPVPAEYYLDSILSDIENICAEIQENPVYLILNACRVLAFLREGRIFSKKQGGEWGAEHLPEKYKDLIKNAAEDYAGGRSFLYEEKSCREFAEYVRNFLLTV